VAFTVTATSGGATANGIAGYLQVLTGQSPSQPGSTYAVQGVLSDSFTPQSLSSYIAGAFGGGGTTPVAETANSPFLYETVSGGSSYAFLECTAPSSPVTLGVASGPAALDLALCEILPGTGLAADPSTPGNLTYAAATTVTSASFSPPPGSLLVLTVAAKGTSGTTTMSVTDTSGLGLDWVQQVQASGGGKGYAGVTERAADYCNPILRVLEA